MPSLQLIFNELSIQHPAKSVYDAQVWMQKLYDTTARAIDCANLEEILLVPQSFLNHPLISGYSFLKWLDDQSVGLELRLALQSLVSWGPVLDDFVLAECLGHIEVKHADVVGLGITLAVHRDHAVMSVDAPPFQEHQLPVRVCKSDVEVSSEVCNFFDAAIIEKQILWFAKRTCVKPEYEHAEHHDPASGKFRGGRGMTSELPADARQVYEKAEPADPKNITSPWWGQNANGDLYRYAVALKGNRLAAHWNGTTERSNPRRIEDRELPERIRQIFRKRKPA